jgi:transglutaminase-like putative cysteine protease
MAFLKRSEPAEALGVGYQIPRNSLALLMVAQAVVVLPHAAHITLWIIGVGFVCGCWRSLVFQGRWDYPQRWVKALLVVASVIGVGVSGKNVFSLETATGLLIVAFALKLVEMKSRRDAYIVIHLCYFIIAAEFLFDQSIGVALYGVLAMIIVTAAFVGLHQLHTRVRVATSLRTAAVLVLQAVPLMLVLFLFFPRVAPLWSVPLPGASRTGISDRIAPGDIAALTRSDEIAFRAVFDGDMPPLRALYWRGLVYSNFSQGTWSAGGFPVTPDNMPVAAGTRAAFLPKLADVAPIDYQVLLEPTQQSWLFALDVAVPVARGTALTRDYRLIADEPVATVLHYRAEAYPDAPTDKQLPDWLRRRETQLPEGDNPRILAFAKDLAQRSDGAESYLDNVLRYIRAEPFFYTLNPPKLENANSIDAFWFDSRRGFCSHFAGAFVYLARAAGIPARMIGGYQGGEVNPLTGHLVVRQFDAHAWAEVWLDGRGWVRMDPTAAVAPARIESGLDAALSESDRQVLSSVTGARFSGVPGLRDVFYLFESMQHRWNLWVVGYDTEEQARYLANLLGEVTPTRVGFAMLLGGGASLALVVVSLFWRRRPEPDHPAQRAFRRFADRLSRSGLNKRPEETPARFLRRVNEARNRPPSEIAELIDQLDGLLYNPDVACSQQALRSLRSRLRRLQIDVSLRARA